MEQVELFIYKHCDKDLEDYNDNGYPYIDSMTYGYSNVLTNNNNSSYDHEFDDTGGGGLGSGITCDVCGERHSEDEVTYSEEYGGYVCDHCLENDGRFFYCDFCHEYHYNETKYELTDGSHKGKSTCSHGLDYWDYVLDHNEDPIYTDNAVRINDEYYNMESIDGEYFYCEGTDEYYFFNDCEYVENENGLYYSEYASQYEEVKEQVEKDKQELELEGVRA